MGFWQYLGFESKCVQLGHQFYFADSIRNLNLHEMSYFLPIHGTVKLLKLLQIRFDYHKFFMISRVHIDSRYMKFTQKNLDG